MSQSTEIALRAEIGRLVGIRDRALARFSDLLAKAAELNALIVPLSPDEWRLPEIRVSISGEGGYGNSEAETYRKRLDTAAWHNLLVRTELRDLMSQKQFRDWEKQLQSDPPEFTLDSVLATFAQMRASSHSLFRQGLVDVFEALPRQFRSHDGFKLGDRCVMAWAVEYNVWSKKCSWRNRNNALTDLDRTFHILAGMPWVVKAFDAADAAMTNGEKEITTRFFKIRWFRNGNVHLWFIDEETTRKANLLLASHYGAALGRMAEKP